MDILVTNQYAREKTLTTDEIVSALTTFVKQTTHTEMKFQNHKQELITQTEKIQLQGQLKHRKVMIDDQNERLIMNQQRLFDQETQLRTYQEKVLDQEEKLNIQKHKLLDQGRQLIIQEQRTNLSTRKIIDATTTNIKSRSKN
ncbi:unnamed protein product [Rotaria magnacalcarata]|uniref:Uncharacterized protein n=1 Tax=Rotaria magnacalcarata TaxID=392030 RepID=A0A819ER88_9BILA|nr:unnamed protein product [Rotaria magnacalcarata]CAF4205743.1 unnamed protein product [Rotaria magnacalcarata]